MGWAELLPVADIGVRRDRPRPHPNVYVSLQTCHFLSVLEADVHVLRASEAAARAAQPFRSISSSGVRGVLRAAPLQ